MESVDDALRALNIIGVLLPGVRQTSCSCYSRLGRQSGNLRDIRTCALLGAYMGEPNGVKSSGDADSKLAAAVYLARKHIKRCCIVNEFRDASLKTEEDWKSAERKINTA